MEIDILAIGGKKTGSLAISDDVFAKPYNEPLIHQVVTSVLSNRHQGTKKQKTRAEVSGGGAKPFKQKGSGRARAGTTRGPIWRHGGVTFAARPLKRSQKINKKMYRAAVCAIFSQLIRDNRVRIIDSLSVDQPKTKLMVTLLSQMKLDSPLIIVDEADENLWLSIRNIPNTTLMTVNMIDPVSLLSHENIVLTKAALLKLNEVLQNG